MPQAGYRPAHPKRAAEKCGHLSGISPDFQELLADHCWKCRGLSDVCVVKAVELALVEHKALVSES